MSKLLKRQNPYAYFNGTSSYIQYADNDIFSFTDGVNDLPFEIEFDIYLTTVGVIKSIVSKGSVILQPEWLVYASTTNTIGFQLNSQITNGIYISIITTAALTLNTSYKIKVTYDGSKLNSGMKIYVNNVVQTTTNSNAGTYLGMSNGTAPMSIGRWASSGIYILPYIGYLRNLKIKKNNQLVFFTPLQDTNAVSTDVIGGLVHNAGTLPVVTNLSENVLKAQNVWNAHLTNTSSDFINLNEKFDFIQQTGKFVMEFEFILWKDNGRSYTTPISSSITGGVGFWCFIASNNRRMYFYFYGTSLSFSFVGFTKVFSYNTPTRVRLVGSDTNLKMYYNEGSGWLEDVTVLTYAGSFSASTATNTARIGYAAGSTHYWYGWLRNFKIWDGDGILRLNLPCQDKTLNWQNLANGTAITGKNVVNYLEQERWGYFYPQKTRILYGSGSQFGWMNQGVFNLQFDLRVFTNPTTSHQAILYTATSAAGVGFFFYFRTDGRIYLYLCNGTGSYAIILTPTALIKGTSYKHILQGNGTQIKLTVLNNDTGAIHYAGNWNNVTYPTGETSTTYGLYVNSNSTAYRDEMMLKNVRFYSDTDGINEWMHIPFQNPENPYYNTRDMGYSLINAVTITNTNENVMKSRDMWRYYDGITNFNAYGNTSTFGWMNSGIWRIEFEVVSLSDKVSNSCIITTGYGNGSTRGFRVYQRGVNAFGFYHTSNTDAGTAFDLTNDKVIGKRYKISIWADGSKIYFTSYDENGINKQDLVGTPCVFTPASTTTYPLCIASLNGSAANVYNTSCYMRNLKIYDANNDLFFFVNLQDATQNGDIVGQTLFATGVSTLVDLG